MSKFITKKEKKSKRKRYFFLLMFLLGVLLSFNYLDKTLPKVDDKKFVEILLNEANISNENTFKSLLTSLFKKIKKPAELLFHEYQTPKVLKASKEEEKPKSEEEKPLIYLYNSHQTEEYAPSNFVEFSINPTVMMVDYVLEDVFNKNNYQTIVEERRIKDVLNQNSWNYNYSYVASRTFMEDMYLNNPSLKFFIDVHRDSLEKDRTTVALNDKSYAKILFLIGLENENYEANLNFTEKINAKIDEKYPGLSKGILKKGGAGVNGVYNQDFSSYTILIEVGGQDNTPNEVLNTALAFAECFMEVIQTEEG